MGFPAVAAGGQVPPLVWHPSKVYSWNSDVAGAAQLSWGTHRIGWQPFWVPSPGLSIAQLGLFIIAAGVAGATFRIGVYGDDGSGYYPGPRVSDSGDIAPIGPNQPLTWTPGGPLALPVLGKVTPSPIPYWIIVARSDATVGANPTLSISGLDPGPGLVWGPVERGFVPFNPTTGVFGMNGNFIIVHNAAVYNGGALPDPFPPGQGVGFDNDLIVQITNGP